MKPEFKHIPFTRRRHCAICRTALDKPLIDLPDFPLTEIYTNHPPKQKLGFLDQAFFICQHCGHGQINRLIDPKVLYANSYFFRTSTSKTACEASDVFLNFVRRTIKQRHFKTIVEVGCNDLYLLNLLKKNGDQLVGIDPILANYQGKVDPKITVIADFIERVDLKARLAAKADLVLSSHVLEHIEDPLPSIAKLLEQANDDALLFFQFPGLESLIGDFRFDQIFHQHMSYFTLPSVRYMLASLGCELIDHAVNPYHWGALMIAFRKTKQKTRPKAVTLSGILANKQVLKRYHMFCNSMSLVAEQLHFLKDERVYGYGAALMLPVLSYHLHNDLSSLTCVVDDDPKKEGLYYINLPVKIKASRYIKDLGGSTILITATTALSNVRGILPKVIALKPKQIIVPLHIF